MRRSLPFLMAAAVLLLTLAVYAPGLGGTFLFDDGVNITENYALRITDFGFRSAMTAATAGESGLLGRPVSMLSFAIDYLLSGSFQASAMKLTNIVIHIATGCALFSFVYLLLQAHQRRESTLLPGRTALWISLTVAAAWLLHPLNLTSVLYVVQRMTSLAALFSLLGLASYVWGRLRIARAPGPRGWLAVGAAFIVFTPLATFSKENGALLPLFLFLTEIAFFRFETTSSKASRALKLVFILTLALPALAILAYSLYHPAWITASYKIRTFSMGERLLTETRVLWLYLRLTFVPDLITMGLYHDDLPVSTSLLNPISTLASSLGLLALAALAVAAWRRHCLLAYGIVFFLAGHGMESSFLALELMHEHRNYLPMVGLLLPLFYYLIRATRYVDNNASMVGAVAVLLSLFAVVTYTRATQWGDPVDMLVMEVQHHPDSTRANLALANFYTATPAESPEQAKMWYENAYHHFSRAAELSPKDPNGMFGLITLQLRAQQPIEPSWLPVIEGRIRNNPLASSTVSTVMRIEMCFKERTCPFEPTLVEGILRAALDNPHPQPFARTQLLFSWSSFLLHEKKDVEGSVKAAYEAAAMTPTKMTTQEALVQALLDAKRYDEAKQRLAVLKGLDRLELNTSRINELAGIIEKHERGAP